MSSRKHTGVHSAMLHDRIMQSADPDYVLVECEAEKVARDAARALQLSRQRCLSGIPTGVPTWTGQNGLNPTARARFGQKKNSALSGTDATPKDDKKSSPSTLSATGRKNDANCRSLSNLFISMAQTLDKTITFVSARRHFRVYMRVSGEVRITYYSSVPLKSNLAISASKKACRKSSARVEEEPLFSGAALIRSTSASCVASSAELLSNMRSKAPLLPDGTENSHDNSRVPEATEENVELIRDIRSFVACGASVDGQATTNEILEQFRSRIPAETTAKFKSMLKRLCSFHKSNGTGIWQLKEEYR